MFNIFNYLYCRVCCFSKMGRVAFIPLPKANDYFVCLAGQEKNTLGFAFKHVMTKVKKESERPSLSRGKKKKKKERWFVKLIQIL